MVSEKGLIDQALAMAHELADQVSARLLEAFNGSREATLKSDGTLVTQADMDADRLIAAALGEHFPEHDIVSEELDTLYEGARWCWVIDPLDGTTNFTQGIPIWAVSIALLDHGQPVMGLIDVPTLGRRYHAVKGGGAFENGEPIHVRAGGVNWQDQAWMENELFATCSRTLANYGVPQPLKPRILGSAAYNFCLVATGAVLAAMEATPRVWDMAAGWLLVREAGGVVRQLEGEPMLPLTPGRDYARVMYPQLVAGSEELVRELMHHMAKSPSER